MKVLLLLRIQERDGQPISVVTAQIITSDIKQSIRVRRSDSEQNKASQRCGVFASGITQQVKQMIIEISIAVVVSILACLVHYQLRIRGWKAPLAVLVSIPLALSGVCRTYVTNGQWNLAALIGVLMLTGIVVTNGIVLIDKIVLIVQGLRLRGGCHAEACPGFDLSL